MTNPYRTQAEQSVLLAIDWQTRLVPAMHDVPRVVWNASRMLRGAAAAGVPGLASEQVPEKLGPTVDELRPYLATVVTKTEFSAYPACEAWLAEQRSTGRHQVVVTGIESHVCVLQTALDLLAGGWRVVLVADAVTSRFPVDREFALRRLEGAGATLATTEMVLFEWTVSSTAPHFRQISQLARESAPQP